MYDLHPEVLSDVDELNGESYHLPKVCHLSNVWFGAQEDAHQVMFF